MERAPLPPHERTWRHPSELGPTHVEAVPSGHTRGVVVASGTLAVMLVAAIVVAMTPRAASNPVAVGVTTAPTTVVRTIVSAPAAADAALRLRSPRIASFTAIPNAIAAVPRSTPSTDATMVVLPDLNDLVVVLTDEFAYPVPWRDVASLAIPDGVVVAEDGTIVAQIIDSNLLVASDSKVGAALALAED